MSDSQRMAPTHEKKDHTLNSASHTASQSPPYTTPLSTKTELRSTRDHHVVDVRQQNTMVPPPQQSYAHGDKPSEFNFFFLNVIMIFVDVTEEVDVA